MRRFLQQRWHVAEELAEKGCLEDGLLNEVGLDLYWDRVYMGQVTGRIDDCEELDSLCFGELFAALEDKLSEEQAEWLCEQQDLEGWIVPCNLERYDLVYDSTLFAIYLRSPPAERDTEFVDLQPRPWMDFEGCIEPEPISGFINYANVIGKRSDQEFSYVFDTDAAFCVQGWVVEGRATYDPDKASPWSHNNLRATHDFADLCTRLTIGEVQSFYPRILTSDRIQGIQYSTHPVIHRNRISYPISDFELFLERDSRVEVWVNELQKNVLHLPAGTHNIRNFPLASGFNQIRLQITDDLGRVEYREFDAIHAPQLLCPGLSNFTASVGVEGEAARFSDLVVASGGFAYGFTERWTGRGGGRADENHQAALLGSDFAFGWGVGGISVAGSHSRYYGEGIAVDVSAERPYGRTIAAARGYYRQRKFLSQNETLDTARTRGLYQLTVNHTLFDGWGYLQATAFRENRWADENKSKLELAYIAEFARHWTVKLTADYDHYRHPQSGFLAIVAYHRTTGFVTHRHGIEARRDAVVFRNTFGGGNDCRTLHWTAEHQRQARKGGKPWDNASLSGRYMGDHFWVNYAGWWDDVTHNADASHVVRLEGALAATGGHWAFGPPIRNAWALVYVDDELGECSYEINGFGRTSRVASQRPLVLTPLSPYRKVEVHAEPVSDEVSILEPRSFVLVPSHRSGHLLRIGLQPGEEGLMLVSSYCLDKEGKPVSLKGLILSNSQSRETVYSFTDEKGVFSVAGLATDALYHVTVVGRPDLVYTLETKGLEVGRELEVSLLSAEEL